MHSSLHIVGVLKKNTCEILLFFFHSYLIKGQIQVLKAEQKDLFSSRFELETFSVLD